MAASSFRLRHYDCIGFDMDHTVCRYRLPAFFEMEYQVLADFLIEERGYDRQLKRPLADDVVFFHKGIIMDIDRGNFVKLSSTGQVMRASHGTRVMSRIEIDKLYGPAAGDDSLKRLAVDPIEAAEGELHRRFRAFRDYFDLPAAMISARIVDMDDRDNGNKPLEKYLFWRDVFAGLVEMFSRDNLKLNAGGFYPEMKARPERYLRRCGDRLKQWLREIKKQQVTYVISGSDPEYVDHIATFCLGRDWKTYFDYIVCSSKKPGFFTGQRPFRLWIRQTATDTDNQIIGDAEFLRANSSSSPSIYIQGNWAQLRSSMGQYSGEDEPKCLYFGDHLIQDVLAADISRVHTVAIVEELVAETSDDPECESDDYRLLYSKRWGSFFHDDVEQDCQCAASGGTVRMNTLWSCLIRDHARLCVSRVETLSDHPVDHPFVPQGENVNKSSGKFLGFLPSPPTCLTSI